MPHMPPFEGHTVTVPLPSAHRFRVKHAAPDRSSVPAPFLLGGGTAVTVDDVRQLKVGDYVASPHDLPAYRPRRISEVPWISANGQFARLCMYSYQGGAWVPPDDFVRAPGSDGKYVWDPNTRTFMRRADQLRGAA